MSSIEVECPQSLSPALELSEVHVSLPALDNEDSTLRLHQVPETCDNDL